MKVGTMSRTSDIRAALAELRKKFDSSNSELIATLQTGRGDPSKGGSFEREVAVMFSMWWSGGEADDLFWRTSGSGARATVRAKRGAKTAGNHGDIGATDARGEPFTKRFPVEIKRGYNWDTVQDMVDRLSTSKQTIYEGFFEQTIRSANEAGTPYWMLIVKRDRHSAMIFTPMPVISTIADIIVSVHNVVVGDFVAHGIRLETFFNRVSPSDILEL